MKTHYKAAAKFTIISIVFFMSNFCWAQTEFGELRGKITDKKTKKVLSFANIVLKQAEKIKFSTLSDENGNYFFKNLIPSTYSLEVSYVGYHSINLTNIKINASTISIENIELTSGNLTEIQQVVIVRSRKELIKNDVSSQTISEKDIIKMPVRGKKLVNPYSSGISIAGSRTDNTRILVNGEVLNVNQYKSESYSKISERGFISPFNEPQSTFSIDVDKASYSNTRRFLNQGLLPPANSVRIEEFINYFDYTYPQPKAGETVALNSELGICPWNKDHLLLKVGVNAQKNSNKEELSSNLVFLIDVSGSMSDYNKLPFVKQSLIMLLDHLDKDDRVAIVVYAGNSGLVLPSTSCSEKPLIKNAINSLESGGSTAGGDGIKLAYKIAKANYISNGINRVILATDGDFNVGVNSEIELEELISMERKSNIFLSVLGFGTGNYQDSKMEVLADKGNGNYSYIDNIKEAEKILVQELNETLITVAKDVKIQIEFNPVYVESYRLIGYEDRMLNGEDFNNDEKDAGEMGSGSTVTALYEITLANNSLKGTDEYDTLRYISPYLNKSSSLIGELAYLKLRYKNTLDSSSKLKKMVVYNTIDKKESDDFQFAAAIAEFGMILRNSEYSGNAGFDSIIDLAKKGKQKDTNGEKAEFIKLVSMAKKIKG